MRAGHVPFVASWGSACGSVGEDVTVTQHGAAALERVATGGVLYMCMRASGHCVTADYRQQWLSEGNAV
jgi:hypothetical protein